MPLQRAIYGAKPLEVIGEGQTMEQISLSSYELCLILLGALSSGAVLAKGLIGGKQHSSLKPVDIALTVVVGGGMMVILTAVMQALNLIGTTPSKVLLILSMFLVLLGSVAIWARIRSATPLS